MFIRLSLNEVKFVCEGNNFKNRKLMQFALEDENRAFEPKSKLNLYL